MSEKQLYIFAQYLLFSSWSCHGNQLKIFTCSAFSIISFNEMRIILNMKNLHNTHHDHIRQCYKTFPNMVIMSIYSHGSQLQEIMKREAYLDLTAPVFLDVFENPNPPMRTLVSYTSPW